VTFCDGAGDGDELSGEAQVCSCAAVGPHPRVGCLRMTHITRMTHTMAHNMPCVEFLQAQKKRRVEVNQTIRRVGIYQRDEVHCPVPGFQVGPLLMIQARVAPGAECVTYAVEPKLRFVDISKDDLLSYPNEFSKLRHSINSTGTHGVTSILVNCVLELVEAFQSKLTGWALEVIGNDDDVANLKISKHLRPLVAAWLPNDDAATESWGCMRCVGLNSE